MMSVEPQLTPHGDLIETRANLDLLPRAVSGPLLYDSGYDSFEIRATP